MVWRLWIAGMLLFLQTGDTGKIDPWSWAGIPCLGPSSCPVIAKGGLQDPESQINVGKGFRSLRKDDGASERSANHGLKGSWLSEGCGSCNGLFLEDLRWGACEISTFVGLGRGHLGLRGGAMTSNQTDDEISELRRLYFEQMRGRIENETIGNETVADFLLSLVGQKVVVSIRQGIDCVGVLIGIDDNANCALEKPVERYDTWTGDLLGIDEATFFIKGNHVCTVGPADNDYEEGGGHGRWKEAPLKSSQA